MIAVGLTRISLGLWGSQCTDLLFAFDPGMLTPWYSSPYRFSSPCENESRPSSKISRPMVKTVRKKEFGPDSAEAHGNVHRSGFQVHESCY